MAVRSSMTQLIARLRLLIADPSPPAAGSSLTFADEDLQNFLDEERHDVRYEVMQPKPTYTTGGIVWTHYYSVDEHWESNVELIWTNFATLAPDTPSVADYIRGHFSFAAGQLPAVLLAGSNYDVWLVAANLLEMRITSLALTTYDFGGAGIPTFHRSQVVANLQKQAATYRARAKPQTMATARCDLTSAGEQARGGAVGSVSAGVPFLTGD